MIVQTIMAKVPEKSDGRGKVENLSLLRDEFNKLTHNIPDVLSMDLYIDDQVTPGNYDVIMISKHQDRSDLVHYQNNPAYLQFDALAKKICTDRKVVEASAKN